MNISFRVKGEIKDSLIFKSDDKTLKHLDKLKEGNNEIQNIICWLEEFSNNTITKDIYTKHKNKSEHDLKINNIKNINEDKVSNLYESNLSKLNYISNGSLLNYSEGSASAIEELNFNIFELNEKVGRDNTLSTISCYIFITLGLYSFFNYEKFENFIDIIQKGYNKNNPYHNDLHAADVFQTCYIYLKYGNLIEILRLNELDYSSYLIAAIIHDYKHPGYTNLFLIQSKNEIAVTYNDQSVLENFHVAEAFKIILYSQECNIFSDISPEDYKIMRKRMIEAVLATDMSLHTKELNSMKFKLESLEIKEGQNIELLFKNTDAVGIFNVQQEFLNTIVHLADVSNPTKPLEVYKIWVDKIMEEFFSQGDKEKDMKLPISFLCDRNTTKIPNSQIGFIDGIVYPLAKCIVEFFPNLNFMISNLNKNKEYYKKLKDESEK